MRLFLFHGRKSPDESLDDWGFQFPEILGVHAILVTYLTTFRVVFDSPESCQAARTLTGWDEYEPGILEMRIEQGLVRTDSPAGETSFFGDWETGFPPIS